MHVEIRQASVVPGAALTYYSVVLRTNRGDSFLLFSHNDVRRGRGIMKYLISRKPAYPYDMALALKARAERQLNELSWPEFVREFNLPPDARPDR